jgi:hypothetical protein
MQHTVRNTELSPTSCPTYRVSLWRGSRQSF